MSLRTLALPFALFVTVFAGCIDEGALPQGQDDVDVPQVWALAELPKVEATVLLENHAKFVKAYPLRAQNTAGHIGARDALATEFEAAGLEVFRHKFTTGIDQENICGIVFGVGEPSLWVVVGGHYDTTTWDATPTDEAKAPGGRVSEGAYDDGSGTRLTVELAKAFATIRSYYSIAFCAFDGEERGLEGSDAFYKAMNDPSVFPYPMDGLRGMVDFDMFGICWPVRSPIWFDYYSEKVYAEADKIRKEYGVPDDMWKKWDDFPIELGSSDYGSFAKHKVPTAFFISDFAELGIPTPVENPLAVPGIPATYPWWHWMDTTETMTAMAGGPDMLAKGFQTAINIGSATVALFALHPEVSLEDEAAA